jgi:hypothetical protein
MARLLQKPLQETLLIGDFLQNGIIHLEMYLINIKIFWNAVSVFLILCEALLLTVGSILERILQIIFSCSQIFHRKNNLPK